MTVSMRAAVVCATLTPFHMRRFEVARATGLRAGHELYAIEVARHQSDYRWIPARVDEREWIQTLFDDDFWSIKYRRMRERLTSVLDRIDPDVVVLPGWRLHDALAGLGWALRRQKARVLISDSQPIDNPQYFPKPQLKRLLVRRYNAAFVAGTPHVKYVTDLGMPAEGVFTGCDVVDNDYFSVTPRSRHDGPLRVLSCLRLLPRKNVMMVLDVLANTTDWTWTIAGDGPQRPEIENRIRQLQLADRVSLLGHVAYSELPRVYAEADAYLQPSLSEPWALAVNEAMAAGLPALVSNACGCHFDLVRPDRNGYTFDPRRPEELARAMADLIARRNDLAMMGDQSRQIISGWGLDHYSESLWNACRSALRRRACQGGHKLDSLVGLAL